MHDYSVSCHFVVALCHFLALYNRQQNTSIKLYTQELQSGSRGAQGVVISGQSGCGKTAVVEQLIEQSFYGEGHTLLVKQSKQLTRRRTLS